MRSRTGLRVQQQQLLCELEATRCARQGYPNLGVGTSQPLSPRSASAEGDEDQDDEEDQQDADDAELAAQAGLLQDVVHLFLRGREPRARPVYVRVQFVQQVPL